MHQPEYRDPLDGGYRLPWTYLHAIKDYADMAAHLEAVPGARAVVNFTPVLLEQLEDYARQIRRFEVEGEPLRDPLLAALVAERPPAGGPERAALVRQCLRANEKRLIERFPPYARLAAMARWALETPETADYLSDRFLTDLLTWYHLAWLAESVRREDLRVRRLMDQARNFDAQDRRVLLHLMGEIIAGLVPRYRALAESGQVELSVTPYAHPILPLLLDFGSAREAWPEVELPAVAGYPGGRERARWHLETGLRVFERFFGFRPQGCWPSEGSLSQETLILLAEAGFRWTATGEGVLRNTLARADRNPGHGDCIHRIWAAESGPLCFFRDDGLSDRIGFTYADWHADDAVGDLLEHLGGIAGACGSNPHAVVSLILDGENAWEYYPENAYHFLRGLYTRLAEDPRFRLTTFSELAAGGVDAQPLPPLVAGSWVYGTFSTWIGDPDKNRAWEMLAEAKETYDRILAEGGLDEAARAQAARQLAICEGSDWFWWFGDYNAPDSVADFERLYRRQLEGLYRILRVRPPRYLFRVFARGHGTPDAGGTMRRGREHP
jgi:alpha-amylase/alpha-mannosidase (GH57 family)